MIDTLPPMQGTGAASEAPASLAILVSTCDAYSDAWLPFFQLLEKFWGDCPYPIYMMTSGTPLPYAKAIPIATGLRQNWSDCLIQALAQIPDSHVLLLLEDYFITKPVAQAEIARLFAAAVTDGWDCLRLFPFPEGGEASERNPEFALIDPGAAYSVCTQAAIWKREFLSSMAVSGESGWEFEIHGSRRASATAAKLASVVKRTDWLYPIPYFCTAIIRGKWEPYAIEVCASLGVTVDTSRRKMRSAWDRASEHPLSGAVRRRVRRVLSILGLSRQ